MNRRTMNRRTGLMIVSLVAAFTLLAVTAFASAPTFEGYEAFKTFTKDNEHQDMKDQGGQLTGSLTIKDNGQTVLDLDTILYGDELDEMVNGTFNIEAGGIEKEIQMFANEDMVYIYDVNKDQFYQVDPSTMEEDTDYDDESQRDFGDRPYQKEMTPAQEELVDFIFGDLKDDFELEKHSDGSETILFELTKDEMPMLLNLMFSAMDNERYDMKDDEMDFDTSLLEKYPLLNEFKDLHVDMPRITENMELDYIRFAMTLDTDGQPTALEFSVIVTGDDINSESHTQQIDGSFVIDLEAENTLEMPENLGNVIVVDPSDFDHNMDSHRSGSFRGRR